MKETVMQFGEGGFLRGFVDYFFHKLAEKGLYDGKIVIVQPLPTGMIDMLNAQDCRYNLFLRGIQDGEVVNERTEITSISRCINPYSDFDVYMALAEIRICGSSCPTPQRRESSTWEPSPWMTVQPNPIRPS